MSRKRSGMPTQRQLRIGEALRHALAQLFARGSHRLPDLESAPVTVTEVRVGTDLKTAKVYILPFAGSDPKELLAALSQSQPWIRHQVAQTVQLKHMPVLRFLVDDTLDRAARIDDLLRQYGPLSQ